MSALQRLIKAYESRDFKLISLEDIFQLYKQHYICIETAKRLAKEVDYVS